MTCNAHTPSSNIIKPTSSVWNMGETFLSDGTFETSNTRLHSTAFSNFPNHCLCHTKNSCISRYAGKRTMFLSSIRLNWYKAIDNKKASWSHEQSRCRRDTVFIGDRHRGQLFAMAATAPAHAKQLREFQHGTSATPERGTNRHTSQVSAASCGGDDVNGSCASSTKLHAACRCA